MLVSYTKLAIWIINILFSIGVLLLACFGVTAFCYGLRVFENVVFPPDSFINIFWGLLFFLLSEIPSGYWPRFINVRTHSFFRKYTYAFRKKIRAFHKKNTHATTRYEFVSSYVKVKNGQWFGG